MPLAWKRRNCRQGSDAAVLGGAIQHLLVHVNSSQVVASHREIAALLPLSAWRDELPAVIRRAMPAFAPSEP
jgi:hypothetical protein